MGCIKQVWRSKLTRKRCWKPIACTRPDCPSLRDGDNRNFKFRKVQYRFHVARNVILGMGIQLMTMVVVAVIIEATVSPLWLDAIVIQLQNKHDCLGLLEISTSHILLWTAMVCKILSKHTTSGCRCSPLSSSPCCCTLLPLQIGQFQISPATLQVTKCSAKRGNQGESSCLTHSEMRWAWKGTKREHIYSRRPITYSTEVIAVLKVAHTRKKQLWTSPLFGGVSGGESVQIRFQLHYRQKTTHSLEIR